MVILLEKDINKGWTKNLHFLKRLFHIIPDNLED